MTPSEQRLCDQLAQLKARLGQCEGELRAARSQLKFIDESMPAMLAYIDSHERYLYHNRAFRDWLGLDAAQIDDRTMREVLGEDIYAGAAPRVRQAQDGKAVRYERTQKTPDGGRYRQFVYLIGLLDGARRLRPRYRAVQGAQGCPGPFPQDRQQDRASGPARQVRRGKAQGNQPRRAIAGDRHHRGVRRKRRGYCKAAANRNRLCTGAWHCSSDAAGGHRAQKVEVNLPGVIPLTI
jgi:PAS domain S-box-containing protein